jgi:hypothetical protein
MEALFASGRIVDLILLGVAVEAGLLILMRNRLGGRAAPLLATLASGAALMLALRAGLIGAPWPAVAGWLLAGLFAHAADLALRARGAGRRRGPIPGTSAAGDAFTRGGDLKRL